MKNKSGSCLNLFNYFIHFRPLVSNTKNKVEAVISFRILSALFLLKVKNQFNNFYDVFIQISGKYKKYLTQRHTPEC